MLKKMITLTVTAASLCTALFAGSKDITMAGSTTVLPIAQRTAEVYMDQHEDVNISVRGGGSGVGIAAIVDGRVDIADASRPIKTKELKSARQNGTNPVGTVVAKDGIAVIVHGNNSITKLNIQQLKDIYTGKIENWKKLGGPSIPIVVVSRDVSSGTFEVFKELVLKGGKVKGGALMLSSNKAVSTTVADTPGAIGYVGLGYLTDKVKALQIQGVLPSNATVNNGSYKLARPLFMYTNGKPAGEVKKYLDFILSSEGQKIVEELGFVPLQ